MMQPNRWSCSITAASIVSGIPFERFVEEIGHDGSEIVHPELRKPMCHRGFHIQEIIDVLMRHGWSCTPIECIPTSTPDGEHIHDVIPEFKIKGRWDHYLDNYSGIVTGQRRDQRNWHWVAWSHKTQLWTDPSGPVLPRERCPVNPASFWIMDYRFRV